MFLIYLTELFSAVDKNYMKDSVGITNETETICTNEKYSIENNMRNLIDVVLEDNLYFYNFNIILNNNDDKFILLLDNLRPDSPFFLKLRKVKNVEKFNEIYISNEKTKRVIEEMFNISVKLSGIIKLLITFDNFLYSIIKKIFPVEVIYNQEIIRFKDFYVEGFFYKYLDSHKRKKYFFIDFLMSKKYHFTKLSKVILNEYLEDLRLIIGNSSPVQNLKVKLYENIDKYIELLEEILKEESLY